MSTKYKSMFSSFSGSLSFVEFIRDQHRITGSIFENCVVLPNKKQNVDEKCNEESKSEKLFPCYFVQKS